MNKNNWIGSRKVFALSKRLIDIADKVIGTKESFTHNKQCNLSFDSIYDSITIAISLILAKRSKNNIWITDRSYNKVFIYNLLRHLKDDFSINPTVHFDKSNQADCFNIFITSLDDLDKDKELAKKVLGVQYEYSILSNMHLYHDDKYSEENKHLLEIIFEIKKEVCLHIDIVGNPSNLKLDLVVGLPVMDIDRVVTNIFRSPMPYFFTVNNINANLYLNVSETFNNNDYLYRDINKKVIVNNKTSLKFKIGKSLSKLDNLSDNVKAALIMASNKHNVLLVVNDKKDVIKRISDNNITNESSLYKYLAIINPQEAYHYPFVLNVLVVDDDVKLDHISFYNLYARINTRSKQLSIIVINNLDDSNSYNYGLVSLKHRQLRDRYNELILTRDLMKLNNEGQSLYISKYIINNQEFIYYNQNFKSIFSSSLINDIYSRIPVKIMFLLSFLTNLNSGDLNLNISIAIHKLIQIFSYEEELESRTIFWMVPDNNISHLDFYNKLLSNVINDHNNEIQYNSFLLDDFNKQEIIKSLEENYNKNNIVFGTFSSFITLQELGLNKYKANLVNSIVSSMGDLLNTEDPSKSIKIVEQINKLLPTFEDREFTFITTKDIENYKLQNIISYNNKQGRSSIILNGKNNVSKLDSHCFRFSYMVDSYFDISSSLSSEEVDLVLNNINTNDTLDIDVIDFPSYIYMKNLSHTNLKYTSSSSLEANEFGYLNDVSDTKYNLPIYQISKTGNIETDKVINLLLSTLRTYSEDQGKILIVTNSRLITDLVNAYLNINASIKVKIISYSDLLDEFTLYDLVVFVGRSNQEQEFSYHYVEHGLVLARGASQLDKYGIFLFIGFDLKQEYKLLNRASKSNLEYFYKDLTVKDIDGYGSAYNNSANELVSRCSFSFYSHNN